MLDTTKIKLYFILFYIIIQLFLSVNAEGIASIAKNLENKLNSNVDLSYNIHSEKYDVNISLTNIVQTFSYDNKTIDESSDLPSITFNNVTVIFQFNLIFKLADPEFPLIIKRNQLSSLITYQSITFLSEKDRSFKLDESISEKKFEMYLGDLFDFSFFSVELSNEMSQISNFIHPLFLKNVRQILTKYPRCIAQENFEHLSGYVEYYANNICSSIAKVTNIKVREIKNEGLEKLGILYGNFFNISMIISYNEHGVEKEEKILYKSMMILGNTVTFGKCIGCTKTAKIIVEESYSRLLNTFEWEK